jgi:hypothetical protein
MSEAKEYCNCHECTQARYRGSFQWQRDQKLKSEAASVAPAGMGELIRSVKSLLDWMPICSVGSSGHKRRVAVEQALQAFAEELPDVPVPTEPARLDCQNAADLVTAEGKQITPEMTKCGNKLCDDGQTLLCQKPAGHKDSEPHESGNWEWWDFSAASQSAEGAGKESNESCGNGWDGSWANAVGARNLLQADKVIAGEMPSLAEFSIDDITRQYWAERPYTAALLKENERLAQEIQELKAKLEKGEKE